MITMSLAAAAYAASQIGTVAAARATESAAYTAALAKITGIIGGGRIAHGLGVLAVLLIALLIAAFAHANARLGSRRRIVLSAWLAVAVVCGLIGYIGIYREAKNAMAPTGTVGREAAARLAVFDRSLASLSSVLAKGVPGSGAEKDRITRALLKVEEAAQGLSRAGYLLVSPTSAYMRVKEIPSRKLYEEMAAAVTGLAASPGRYLDSSLTSLSELIQGGMPPNTDWLADEVNSIESLRDLHVVAIRDTALEKTYNVVHIEVTRRLPRWWDDTSSVALVRTIELGFEPVLVRGDMCTPEQLAGISNAIADRGFCAYVAVHTAQEYYSKKILRRVDYAGQIVKLE